MSSTAYCRYLQQVWNSSSLHLPFHRYIASYTSVDAEFDVTRLTNTFVCLECEYMLILE